MKRPTVGIRKGADARVESDSASAGPTVRPPFDPARFARESESTLSSADLPDPAPSTVRATPMARSAVSGFAPSGPALEETEIEHPLDALGGDAVPILLASREELEWHDLPPDACRLLAELDGLSSLDAVCIRANVSPEDGTYLLLDLVEQGLVSFR